MFKVNSDVTGVFIVKFEHISLLVLVFNLEQINAGWDNCKTRAFIDCLRQCGKSLIYSQL